MMDVWLCLGSVSLLNIDTTSFLQSSLSRASFVGLLCGSILGYPFESFIVGVLIELVLLDFPPIGGMPVPNGCIASGISASLIPVCGPYYSFFVGLLGGTLYSYVEKIIRQRRSFLNILAERYIELENFNFGGLIFISIFIEFVVSFIYLISAYFVFSTIYKIIPLSLSEYVGEALRISLVSVVFVVFSSLFFKFLNQVRKNA